MNKIDWKDVLDRAEWTFAQAAIAVVAAAGTSFVDVALWKSAAIAGGAAVISLLKNVFVQVKDPGDGGVSEEQPDPYA